MSPRLTAMDFITDCLSVRGNINGALRAVMASGRLDWHAVIELANIQLMTPALWVALRNRGLVEELPADVREYLCELHRLNTLRNQQLKAQVIEAVGQLNAVGVEPVLLKGSASLFVKTFDDPGSRVMKDIDILVPKQDADKCWNALRSLGYAPVDYNFNFPPRHHHLRAIYRPGEYGTIEIHLDVAPESTAGILPVELIWRHREPIDIENVMMSAPTPSHRILHNLVHSALTDRTYLRGGIPLQSLYELALTQTLCNERIDWTIVFQLMDNSGKLKVLRGWLYLAHRLFGSSLPDCISPTSGAVAHYIRSRLQARWVSVDKIITGATRFSTRDICERYQCSNNFLSLAKGRIRLAAEYSGRLFRWIERQLRSDKAWNGCI